MESDSDSSLSSAPEEEVKKLAPIFLKAKKATKKAAPPPVVSPPRPKREPSPPHEEVLADNPDIAFIVMFRSRFTECFPGRCPNFGPQDVERGVVETIPSPEIQHLLCSLLGMVLNRKKPVERTAYGRAMEEAVLAHKNQWPLKWAGQNPLHGNRDFNSMSPTDRLNFLRTLIIWALGSSELVSATIKDRYKQQRHSDDENQPLSVQPWGVDGDKRRYFLVQGLDDTSFRVYREGSRHTKNAHWYSVAGGIEELKAIAEDKLQKVDGTQAARRLAGKMINAVPTFEATEEKRRRREQRQAQRARFTRPELGFGIYEGRTRGKRPRYNYDDDADADFGGNDSDATSTRRSARYQSNRSTPFESGPQFTASGRQIKQPRQGEYGESRLSTSMMNSDEITPDYSTRADTEDSEPVRSGGRSTRNGGRHMSNGPEGSRKRKHIDGYNGIDEMSDEEEADANDSENGWNSDDNADDKDEEMMDADDLVADDLDADESEVESEESEQDSPSSLIVKLKISPRPLTKVEETPATSPSSPGAQPEEENNVDAKITANSTSHDPMAESPKQNGIARQEPPTSGLYPSSAEHTVPASALPPLPKVIAPVASSEKKAQYQPHPPSGMTHVNGFVPVSTPLTTVQNASGQS